MKNNNPFNTPQNITSLNYVYQKTTDLKLVKQTKEVLEELKKRGYKMVNVKADGKNIFCIGQVPPDLIHITNIDMNISL